MAFMDYLNQVGKSFVGGNGDQSWSDIGKQRMRGTAMGQLGGAIQRGRKRKSIADYPPNAAAPVPNANVEDDENEL